MGALLPLLAFLLLDVTVAHPFRLSRNPFLTATLQYLNDTVRDWVEEAIKPLPYGYETPLLYHWEEMQQPPDGSLKWTPNDVVLMTQASPERLPFVRRAMSLFMGPAAVAVFIPMPVDHPEASACRTRVLDYMKNSIRHVAHATGKRSPPFALSLLYANSESPIIHCNLTESSDGLNKAWMNHTTWDAHIRDRPYIDIYDAEYPVGILRQLAFELVPEHKFVFMMDSDFVFPPGFAKRLTSGSTHNILSSIWKKWHEKHERQAVIVAAFERNREPSPAGKRETCAPNMEEALNGTKPCWIYSANLDVPVTKQYLTQMVEDRSVIPFYESQFRVGHSCYRPRRTLMTDEPYDIEYKHPCEPYMVGLRAAMPPFDERWRGRGYNKINYLTHVWVWGTQFTVDPTIFIIHLPHATATSLIAGHEDLPESMSEYEHESQLLPVVLSRIFMADISVQPETQRSVKVWRPLASKDDESKEDMYTTEWQWASNRQFERAISPWHSGMAYTVSMGANVTHEDVDVPVVSASINHSQTTDGSSHKGRRKPIHKPRGLGWF